MKTYFSDIIPRIQRYSKELDNLTLLTNQHWVVIDDIDEAKNVYIFRSSNELLISQNGKVEKARWEYLGGNSLLIDRNDESYLFKHGFFDENILALKIDSKEEYAFLVNESKYEKELNSLGAITQFLDRTYIAPHVIQTEEIIQEHIAPRYRIIDKSGIFSLFYSKRELYTIAFQDGSSGKIYLIKDDKKAYFKEEPNRWASRNCYYADFESCVNALYYFLKTKKILNTGFICINNPLLGLNYVNS